MPPADAARYELMIVTIARLLHGLRHVAVGARSPVPAAGALLARHLSGGRLTVSILGDDRQSTFTDGNRELFDCAAQGRLDAFFLSGAQIDKAGNVNLLGLGQPDHLRRRFMGSFGAPYMALLVPNLILFQMDHSSRTLVERVDIVTAPGVSEPGIFRRGSPRWLITNRCLFVRSDSEFRLSRLHAPETVESVCEATGFDFAAESDLRATEPPGEEEKELIRGPVREAVTAVYPDAARLFDAS